MTTYILIAATAGTFLVQYPAVRAGAHQLAIDIETAVQWMLRHCRSFRFR